MKNILTKFIDRKLIKHTAAVLFLTCSVSVASATTISFVVLDEPGEGFNDTGAAFPNQTGNTGSNLGQQRINVLQAAADFWQERLVGFSDITIDLSMDPLSCDAFSGTLGSAGPTDVFVNIPGEPIENVAYVAATTNSLISFIAPGFDVDPLASDITATFNVDIDNNDECLINRNWWLGIDSPAPFGTISLYDTVLHEIAHGLGVVSLTALTAQPEFEIEVGDFLTGEIVPVYDFHLKDESLGLTWGQMTSAQRATSITNTGNLVWNGDSANDNSDHLDASSRTNNRIRMYAPNEVEPGSSVSHWDTALTPDELMEPFATGSNDARSTLQLLEDVGWVIQVPGDNVTPDADDNFLLDIIPAIIRATQSPE